jgi:uncharacterized protein (DUF885 family)
MALFALTGCGAPPPPPPAAPLKSAAPLEQLNRIVERYWDEHLSLENAISPQFLADSLSVERRYLAELLSVPRERLDANSQLTYDIFKRQREVVIEGFTFPAELLPLNPFGGMPQQFAALAADLGQPPLINPADYDNWLGQIDAYVRWTQQAIVNMREGIRRGYTSPRALIERVLPILEGLGAENSANVFYLPLHSMPETIKASERTRLTSLLSAAISQKLLPANRALHDFLQREYLPRARAGIAWSELPLGSQWYAYRIKRATGASLSPEQIHRLGLAEVERIGGRAPAPLAPESGAGAVLDTNGLVNAYKDLAAQVRAALPSLFSGAAADMDIRATAWLPQPATRLYYQRGGPTGIPPAVLYVDAGAAANRSASISSFLQQAWPGHQYQITLQQQRMDLPRFRRFGAEAAYIDGWGLYAASLGDSLGLYPNEAAQVDALATEMRCKLALVVDTGINAQGWTRAQALDYLHAHGPISDPDAQLLVDWYAANPADALACGIGGLKFHALRASAQQALAGRFEVRDFHTEILKDGAMPLDILEAKMKAWTQRPP